MINATGFTDLFAYDDDYGSYKPLWNSLRYILHLLLYLNKEIHIYQPLPLGQDMIQGQFLSGV